MGIVTKRNGKILMGLGITMSIISFLIMIIFPNLLWTRIGEEYVYYPLAHIVYSCFFVGPFVAVVGIPLFVVGARRIPSRLMQTLKGETHIRTRTKISFLAQQLAIKEKDVISLVSRLRSNGEPISIDGSRSEVIYDPALSPPSAKIKKPSMTLYEKLTVIFTILSIFVTIIITFLK